MLFLKKNYGFFIVLVLSFWAIKDLFIPGFFPMHDDTQVARVFEMGKVLKSGIFPVRVVPDLGYGYGYPLFNFYAPLAYYVGGIFMLLGFDALTATKIMMGLGIVLAGIFMYLLSRKFFGELGGVVSGLFYTYAPYHALDIYVRGDVAEFWAYAFIPLAFLGFYKNNLLIGALGFAGIILSHNLTAMMVTPFLLIFIMLNCYIAYKNNKLFIIRDSLFIIFLGLAISSFYWLPALLELKNTNVLSQIGGGADFNDHFICFSQLWSSPWGFGGSAKGCIDGMSFMIGKLHILGWMAALALLFILRNKNYNFHKQYNFIILSFTGFILSIFFTLELSKPIWEAIPIMAFLQYPWRFLLLISFFSSLICGSLVFILRSFKIKSYITALFLVLCLLFFNIKLFIPQTIVPKISDDYTNEIALKWTASKISDEFLPTDFKKPNSEKEVVGRVSINFQETSIEKASNAVSIAGLLVMSLAIILFRRKTKK